VSEDKEINSNCLENFITEKEVLSMFHLKDDFMYAAKNSAAVMEYLRSLCCLYARKGRRGWSVFRQRSTVHIWVYLSG
jgi:hypothetical protein